MDSFKFNSEFFNIKDTLECGQVFRFIPYKKGYKVFSLDKCAYVYEEKGSTVIFSDDLPYFKIYFDLDFDYKNVYGEALNSPYPVLRESAKTGKGIRLLNQDKTETLFSFIVSQNNNIPRIKGIIEKLCSAVGEKKFFGSEPYFAFPNTTALAKLPLEFYQLIGLGYRAEYIRRLAVTLSCGFSLDGLSSLSTENLKKELLKIYGVGPKVADCVTLFGFKRGDSFPVDTWIEKVYLENFGGKLNDRKKISQWFVDTFKDNSGIFQQYLFYYKRTNG